MYNACKARGIQLTFIMDYGNTLYGTDPTTTTWLNGFTNYAKAATTHYKGDGNIWEIWNEPNGSLWQSGSSNPTQYMNLVKQVVPAIRMADPNSTILGPAITSTSTYQVDTTFLTTCFQQGLLNYVDAVSIHPYKSGAPEGVTNDYATVRSLMATYGKTLPICSSEWGYPAIDGYITHQKQGYYLARSFFGQPQPEHPTLHLVRMEERRHQWVLSE